MKYNKRYNNLRHTPSRRLYTADDNNVIDKRICRRPERGDRNSNRTSLPPVAAPIVPRVRVLMCYLLAVSPPPREMIYTLNVRAACRTEHEPCDRNA